MSDWRPTLVHLPIEQQIYRANGAVKRQKRRREKSFPSFGFIFFFLSNSPFCCCFCCLRLWTFHPQQSGHTKVIINFNLSFSLNFISLADVGVLVFDMAWRWCERMILEHFDLDINREGICARRSSVLPTFSPIAIVINLLFGSTSKCMNALEETLWKRIQFDCTNAELTTSIAILRFVYKARINGALGCFD